MAKTSCPLASGHVLKESTVECGLPAQQCSVTGSQSSLPFENRLGPTQRDNIIHFIECIIGFVE